MKKILLILSALCVMHFATEARSKSKLHRLNTIRVGSDKTVRGYTKITVDPASKGEVHIAQVGDKKHEITGMENGVVILQFHDEDGEITEKAIDITKRRPQVQPNVSFGFGWGYRPRGYYYISSDPFYDPYWGWGGCRWRRPYYRYW